MGELFTTWMEALLDCGNIAIGKDMRQKLQEVGTTGKSEQNDKRNDMRIKELSGIQIELLLDCRNIAIMIASIKQVK